MKKIFNTIFVCGFLAAVCAMYSSCLILVDDEALGGCGITVETTTTPAYSTIKVNNIIPITHSINKIIIFFLLYNLLFYNKLLNCI